TSPLATSVSALEHAVSAASEGGGSARIDGCRPLRVDRERHYGALPQACVQGSPAATSVPALEDAVAAGAGVDRARVLRVDSKGQDLSARGTVRRSPHADAAECEPGHPETHAQDERDREQILAQSEDPA